MKPFRAYADMSQMTLRDLNAMFRERGLHRPLREKWLKEHKKTAAWQQTLERYGLK
jgi:hypothetical protein